MKLVLTLRGAPRTLKNHGRTVPRWSKKKQKTVAMHVPSLAHKLWHDTALLQLRPGDPQVAPFRASLPFTEPVHVKAIFYRAQASGDLVGYEQALGDLLEHAGILKNDVLIESWDGTRLRKDATNPRIELMVRPMVEEPPAVMFPAAAAWLRYNVCDPSPVEGCPGLREGAACEAVADWLDEMAGAR